jgi:hypothetical protein
MSGRLNLGLPDSNICGRLVVKKRLMEYITHMEEGQAKYDGIGNLYLTTPGRRDSLIQPDRTWCRLGV